MKNKEKQHERDNCRIASLLILVVTRVQIIPQSLVYPPLNLPVRISIIASRRSSSRSIRLPGTLLHGTIRLLHRWYRLHRRRLILTLHHGGRGSKCAGFNSPGLGVNLLGSMSLDRQNRITESRGLRSGFSCECGHVISLGVVMSRLELSRITESRGLRSGFSCECDGVLSLGVVMSGVELKRLGRSSLRGGGGLRLAALGPDSSSSLVWLVVVIIVIIIIVAVVVVVIFPLSLGRPGAIVFVIGLLGTLRHLGPLLFGWRIR